MEVTPELFYTLPSQQTTNEKVQSSYWKHAYGIAQVLHPENDTQCCFDQIDNYWEKAVHLSDFSRYF